MEIFVFTSDNYHHCLPPFLHLMEKYWPGNHSITIVGFARPDNVGRLDGRVAFLSLGDQANYPWNRYSNALIKFLDHHAPETFILMLEDYWLVREVNDKQVQECYEYTAANPDVLRFDICADRLGSSHDVGYYKSVDLVQSSPQTMYHMSLWTSIWNRDQMRRVIIPDETAHDIEIFGTTRTRELSPQPRVLGTRNYPLRQIAALRGRDTVKWNLDGLSEQDRKELAERGWL